MSAENPLPISDTRASRLPIPNTKGSNPFFTLSELLFRERETGRVECSFNAIEDYLRSHTRHQIPEPLSASLSRMERWQLIYPNTFDLSQILFIGKSSYPKGYIPIAEAEATIYFHRGAQDGDAPTQKPYTKPWKMELVSVYPDSNGEPRVLAVYYRLHTEDGDFSSQSIRVSIRDDELVGRENESDTVFGPVLKVATEIPEIPALLYPAHCKSYRHPFNDYGGVGVMTPGMFDLAPTQHRLMVGPFYGRTVINLSTGEVDTSPPKNKQGHAKNRGMYVGRKEGVWEMGLDEQGTDKPWVIAVPNFLERSPTRIPKIRRK